MPNFAGLRRNIIVQLSLTDTFTADLEKRVGAAKKTPVSYTHLTLPTKA